VEQFEGDRKKRLIEDRDAYKRAAAGDIAYNTMRMWQGAVGDVPVDGLVSPAYVVARPIKDINSRYYSFLFRGQTFQVETNRHSYGIVSDRNRLYWLGFKNIVVPIPPRAEQDRIVAFLDEKTAQIDALIAKKQRQIELLDEQKAILINRAVTRGLNSQAELQDSGIPWIGPIPKHWKVTRFKFCAGPLEQGWSPQCDNRLAEPEGWGVVKVGCVNGGVFKPEEHKAIPKNIKPDESLRIRPRDFLVSRANSRELVGSAALASESVWSLMLCDKVYRCRIDQRKLLPDLAVSLFATKSPRNQLEIGANGASDSMQNISQDVVKNLWLPLPPLAEQAGIVSFLREASRTMDEVVAKTESQIQTLQTLRSTLIAHAVTGKIAIPAATV
jgi:type I restriction enzyme S subunit